MVKVVDKSKPRTDNSNDKPQVPANANVHEDSSKAEQLKAAKGNDSKQDTQNLVSSGIIPHCTIDGAPTEYSSQADRVPPQPETAQERLLRAVYQRRFIDGLEQFATADIAAAGADTPTKLADALQKQKADIEAEQQQGQFGPASQKAYKQYVDWIQKLTVPPLLANLQDLGIPAPPGAPPIKNPDGSSQSPDPRLLAATGKLPDDLLKVDTSKPPTSVDFQKIEATLDWEQRADASITAARHALQDSRLTETIKQRHLPASWLYQPGTDKDAWRQSAQDMVDLAVRTTRSVDAMDRLHRSGGKFPLELPPGTAVTRDESGKITQVHLDLPDSLRQEEPHNRAKIERLREWLDTHAPKIKQAVGELANAEQNTGGALSWGSTEVSSVKDENGKRICSQGLFDSKGNLLQIVDPRRVKPEDIPAGGSLKELNLLDQKFDVKTLPNGDIQVTQNVQAELVPWYGYQNLGAAKIEHEMKLEPRVYKPDDFVSVASGGKTELIQAKDLDEWKSNEQAKYYGGKAINVAMDVAMVVSGTVELGVAIKAGRLLLAGAEAATALTGREVLMKGIDGSIRAGMGLAGLGNNAGAHNTDLGAAIEKIRGDYFVFDSVRGLYQLARSAPEAAKAAEQLASADNVKSLIDQTGWMRVADGISTPTFKILEAPIAIQVGTGLVDQIVDLANPDAKHLAQTAIDAFGDGQGLQKARPNDFNTTDQTTLDSARKILENYKQILRQSRGEEARVSEILDKTSRLLTPDASQKERDDFKKELASSLMFTSDDIKRLESKNKDHAHRLTPEQLESLANSEKRASYPDAKLKEEATKIMLDKNKSVRVASEIALLYLSRDKDGKLPDQLAPAQIVNPAVVKLEDQVVPQFMGGTGIQTVPVWLPQETVQLNITPQMVTADLRGMLENERNKERGIACGDMLLRLGAISHSEYGAELQEVLLSSTASKANKMEALVDSCGPRLSAIIAGLEHEELERKQAGTSIDTASAQGRSFGVSSTDLRNTLKKVAGTDSDPDVRAMAAAISCGLNLQEVDPEAGSRALLLTGKLWKELQSQPSGTFAENITAALQKVAEAPLNERTKPSAEAASKALLLLSKDKPELLPKCMQTIAACSENNPDKIAKNLSMLTEEQLKSLDASNPALAISLRGQALSLLQHPENIVESDKLARTLPSLVKVISGGSAEQIDLLKTSLHSFVECPAGTVGYNRLRTAAINELVCLGDQASLPAIRIAAQNDPHPMVREAAIAAMAALKDSELNQLIPALLKSETDLTILARLKDLQANSHAPSDALPSIDNAADSNLHKEHLDGFSNGVESRWITKNFPLLDQKSFAEEAAEAASKNHSFHWDTFFASLGADETTIDYVNDLKKQQRDQEDSTAIQQVQKAREQQFVRLCDMAKGDANDPNTDLAKKVLQDLIETGGGILHRTDDLTIRNTDYHIQESASLWQAKAAAGLADASTLGNPGRDLLAKSVARDLCNTEVDATAKIKLLEAWDKLTASQDAAARDASRDRFAISRREAQQVVNTALSIESKKSPQKQAEQLQLVLLKSCNLIGNAETRTALVNLSSTTAYASVRAQIALMLAGNQL